MEPKHSPAPFSLKAGHDGNHIIRDSFGDSICYLAKETGDHPQEEQKANGELFCASPEMLQAIEMVLEWRQGLDDEWQVDDSFPYIALEKARAKAKGESDA